MNQFLSGTGPKILLISTFTALDNFNWQMIVLPQIWFPFQAQKCNLITGNAFKYFRLYFETPISNLEKNWLLEDLIEAMLLSCPCKSTQFQSKFVTRKWISFSVGPALTYFWYPLSQICAMTPEEWFLFSSRIMLWNICALISKQWPNTNQQFGMMLLFSIKKIWLGTNW